MVGRGHTVERGRRGHIVWTMGLTALGIDLTATRALRRRFAFACLDWSERRPHLGGALGAAVLQLARRRRWVSLDLDSRALHVTAGGRTDMRARFGLDVAFPR